MKKLILDLSYYQQPDKIDYAKLSSQIDGVILRAGYTGWGSGSSYYKDTAFENHYKQFKKRGVPVGAYWYSCADTVADGRAEAEWMVKNCLAGKKFELPIYWDTEDEHYQRKTDKTTLTNTGLAFLNVLEDRGYFGGIYASVSWLRAELELSRIAEYPLWIASYGVSDPRFTEAGYGLWQFTSTHKLDGFAGGLDASYQYIDYTSTIKQKGLNGFSASAPTAEPAAPKMTLSSRPVLICFKNDGDAPSALALQNAMTGLCKTVDVRKGDPDDGDDRYIVQVGGAAVTGAHKVLSGATRREVLVACGEYIRELTTL